MDHDDQEARMCGWLCFGPGLHPQSKVETALPNIHKLQWRSQGQVSLKQNLDTSATKEKWGQKENLKCQLLPLNSKSVGIF